MKPEPEDIDLASTEPAEPARALCAARSQFIELWGDMASQWGINRTMAQIHALLYVSEEPLDTDAIMERLSISRGNANMNLRALMEWELAEKRQVEGSRKDFFVAEKDVWTITTRIIRERQRREIQPVVKQIEACRAAVTPEDGAPGGGEQQQFAERMDNLLELMDLLEGVTQALLPLVQNQNVEQVRKLVAVASKLPRRKAKTEASR